MSTVSERRFSSSLTTRAESRATTRVSSRSRANRSMRAPESVYGRPRVPRMFACRSSRATSESWSNVAESDVATMSVRVISTAPDA
jgi:hypothetical protein